MHGVLWRGKASQTHTMTAFLVGALLHCMGFSHGSREQGMGQGLGVGTPPLSSLGLLAPTHS